MIGMGLFTTYDTGVPSIGFSWGGPSYVGVLSFASLTLIAAVSGRLFAITASCACGVPGTDAFTFSLGLSSGIFAKSGGRSLPGTNVQGPARASARNHRPATSTYVRWSARCLKTWPVVFEA